MQAHTDVLELWDSASLMLEEITFQRKVLRDLYIAKHFYVWDPRYLPHGQQTEFKDDLMFF